MLWLHRNLRPSWQPQCDGEQLAVSPQVDGSPSPPTLHADLVLQHRHVDLKGGHGFVQILHVRLHQVKARIDRRKSAIVEDLFATPA
jgi:hypothetical protein